MVLGIAMAHWHTIPNTHTLVVALVLLLFLFIDYKRARHSLKRQVSYGILTFSLAIILGICSYNLHNQKNFKTHYSQQYNLLIDANHSMIFKIRERLKPSIYHEKYIVELLEVDRIKICGKLLVNIKRDSLTRHYKVDDVLFTEAELKTINPPLNPDQFNFKRYLERQYIYNQITLGPNELLTISTTTHTLLGYAETFRQHINTQLKSYNFAESELAIINALLLGQRQDIDKRTYESYANAGAIHILAVSGLHIGIILWLLNYLLRPLERVKHGKTFKACIIVLILWCFAIVAGLSPSVTRAVTMFSIIAVSMHLRRPTNIYNTLAFSILLLLLFRPMLLFEVGFQMSYLAVLAIVSIQPILYQTWKPQWKIVDYFWNITTVTLAAQIGVAPISLYYFHQFPGLFFISNLAIIPFLGFILGLGILVILLAITHLLPEILAQFYGLIIQTMNTLVSWVSMQEAFLFKDISIHIFQVITSYVILLTLIMFQKHRDYRSLRHLLLSVLLFQSVSIYIRHQTRSLEFIIFHKSRHTIMAQKHNHHLTIFHNLDSTDATRNMMLANYRVTNFIDTIEYQNLEHIFQVKDTLILVVDSLGVYHTKSFQPDYILLRNSPKINLERLIDSIHPKMIIADASNYKSYVNRWRSSCLKKQLPFHYTGEKGAFIIKF
ncbi:ComEC/Rec2 family competence protein [Psychroserpens sp. BH13MA-6]